MAKITSSENTFRVTLRNRGTARAYVIVTIDERDVPVSLDGEGCEYREWSEAAYPSARRIARALSRIVGRVVGNREIDDCSGGENGEAIYPLRLRDWRAA